MYTAAKFRAGVGIDVGGITIGPKAQETEEFKSWEANKYRKMKAGLGFLTLGFLLQLAAIWI